WPDVPITRSPDSLVVDGQMPRSPDREMHLLLVIRLANEVRWRIELQHDERFEERDSAAIVGVASHVDRLLPLDVPVVDVEPDVHANLDDVRHLRVRDQEVLL